MVQIPAEETSAFFFHHEFTMNKKGLWQRLKIPLSHTEKNLGQMVLPSLQSSGFCCYCEVDLGPILIYSPSKPNHDELPRPQKLAADRSVPRVNNGIRASCGISSCQ